MRGDEVLELPWERVVMATMVLRIEGTESGEPLEWPITWQIASLA